MDTYAQPVGDVQHDSPLHIEPCGSNARDPFRLVLPGLFCLSRTLECGQCFRWNALPDGSYEGVVHARRVRVRQEGSALLFWGASAREIADIWVPYFDLKRDYDGIDRLLCHDPRLAAAAVYARGIRILRQDPWETLCSFILSQNNNIPRIRGLVERLCLYFGDQLPDGVFGFPPPERLATLCPDDLAPVRSGFRARYLIDAAQRVVAGDVVPGRLANLPLYQARRQLQQICGVGEKVALCTLLYGAGHMDAFPEDVWIKRVMARLFPEGLPGELLPVAGIAQQYLFHYGRIHKIK